MRLFSPIHHTFGPHVTARFLVQSLGIALVPWAYRRGKSVSHLSHALAHHFQGECFLFSSGREALLAYLKSVGLKPGEEVIVQGYTCVVIPNAIHAAGGVPIYADIDPETLNLDLSSVRAAISPRTRVIICQHTFGIPAEVLSLRSLCDEYGILLIEDLAHFIPETCDGQQQVGRYGDAVLLSFGRDKALSGIAGGAVICRKSAMDAAMHALSEASDDCSFFECIQLLCYPILYALSRPMIGLGIGKGVLSLARMTGIMPAILTEREKNGSMSPVLRRMPNVCAFLALQQWRRLSFINAHRRSLTAYYFQHARKHGWPVLSHVLTSLALQKFPLFVSGAEGIRHLLKTKNIHLDDGWTGCTVCPSCVENDNVNYRSGESPCAEMAGAQILSLPTHPTMSLRQARALLTLLDPLLNR